LLTFSEGVDRATFQRALSFTPEMALMPKIDWKGERVDLTFLGPLNDRTTYILTLDKELKDNRGVSLNRPITLAFSTGPVIDKGAVEGRVLNASNGRGVEGMEVLAFKSDAPTVMSTRPAYRTQTDGDGSFSLRHLAPVEFLIVGVEDRNRNRMIDSAEVVALPWWGAQLPDTGATAAPVAGAAPKPSWLLHRRDDRPPGILQLEPSSSRRLEVRFSEPVLLLTLEPDRWTVTDTLSGAAQTVLDVYQPYDERRKVILVTDSLREGAFTVGGAGVVADSAGNQALLDSPTHFRSTARPDTLRLRFEGFGPKADARPAPLLPDRVIDLGSGLRPSVRFNQSVNIDMLLSMVQVIPDRFLQRADTSGVDRTASFSTTDRTTWVMDFDPPAKPGDSITVAVRLPEFADSTATVTYVFADEIIGGSVSGVVDDTTAAPILVSLVSLDRPSIRLETTADTTGRFAFERLLKGRYTLSAFVDFDRNGRWTFGGVDPLRFPEPISWHTPVLEVRQGWESDVDTLRLAHPMR
jgi:hypothetical protein